MSPWFTSPILNLIRSLFFRNRWAVKQNALLWVLTISTEQGRPLIPMLEALAQDEDSYHWRLRLEKLVEHLKAGMPLPDALDRVPKLLPADVVLAIRVGEETGTPAEMLREVSKNFSRQQQSDLDSKWSINLTYLAGLLLVLTSVVSFVMYYIIPKFKYIFESFGTELPGLTQGVIEASDYVINYWYLIIGLGGLAVWLALKWLFSAYPRPQAADILHILSVVVARGRPLVGALSTMARHHPHGTIRNRLLYIRNEVERGSKVFELFVETGLLSKAEARILDSAQRAGNLPWALEELAGRIERDVDYRTAVLVEILRPVILMTVAIGVGLFVLGMFLPLIKLIYDLT